MFCFLWLSFNHEPAFAVSDLSYDFFLAPPDSTSADDSLIYPIRDKKEYEDEEPRQFDLKKPENITEKVTYNPDDNTYTIQSMIGNTPIGNPKTMSSSAYYARRAEQDQKNYFREKSEATNFVRSKGFNLGGLSIPDPEDWTKNGFIDIRPSGSAEVIFGGNWNKVENPNFTARQQRNGQFDFKLKMQVNVTGQIGDRIKVNTNYNTDATFEFDNQMKLNWEGKEDDIIKSVELGNVNLPLTGSLIQGSQSLFGAKVKMQFGALTVTTIVTQDKGETRETQITGDAQVTQFNIKASDYDANRHFFLAQYFAENYDRSLSNLPVVQSNVRINYIEVWVMNRSTNYNNTGNLIAMMDLGEDQTYRDWGKPGAEPFPDNRSNLLYETIKTDPALGDINTITSQFNNVYPQKKMQTGVDYVILNNARRLNEQEFTYNERLGYISLNQALNSDEVLAVSYEYQYNGRIYKVGEFARDNPPTQRDIGTLIVKMLKSTIIKTNLPTWDLMMKNVYSLGAFNMQTEDFSFNIVYSDDKGAGDVNYLPVESSEKKLKNKILNEVFNLDRMNRLYEAKQDGLFDIIEGVTIQTQKGRIIFPVREPFGDFLREKFTSPDGKSADYYAFDALYDSTKWDAEQDVQHDKFFLRGSYKGSSSNQIRLQCFNVPQGSVTVTANGSVLNEGTDYVVDYTIGVVTIVNEGIMSSGAVIKASCESNSLFNIQQKTKLGTRLDYIVSDKLLLGGTILHLSERPLTPKTNIGEEPLLNTIWGFDGAYNTKSRMLTRLVDRIPLIETKEESSVALTWEFAQIIPHKPRSIGNTERGTSFIDDFEAAETPYELKEWTSWRIASIPQHQPELFPYAAVNPQLENNRRAKLAWYRIDPIYQNSQKRTPEHLKKDVLQRSSHFTRIISLTEVYPEKQLPQGTPQSIPTLDLAYYPKERGDYNFDVDKLNADGSLQNPKNRWAGISRRIETTDFEAANIDYIEIWIMDPFHQERLNPAGTMNSGQLYLNIGSVSEDVLPDNSFSQEQGLPTQNNPDTAIKTPYAFVPRVPSLLSAFDNNPSARPLQDVGLDGMNDAQEREFHSQYLQDLEAKFGSTSKAYIDAYNDPAGDNYLFHRDPSLDGAEAPILERYKRYNSTQGNSTVERRSDDQTPMAAYVRPDEEDINGDRTLDLTEEYFQYRIDLSRSELRVGNGYIADETKVYAEREDKGAKPDSIRYYQLKIPVREYEKRVGGIQNFKSIRFMRMFLTGFDDSVVVRILYMNMVRADWRRYPKSLKEPPSIGPPPNPLDPTEFVISTVNIEENSSRKPIRYVEPPNISREVDPTQPVQVLQNEQSLSLRVCELEKGDARGAFKVTELDIRNYEKIKMYLHAEGKNVKDGDVWAYIRMGTDLENNYYQYELPLRITPTGSFVKEDIWPSENNLEITLEDFYNLKLERNQILGNNTAPYSKTLDNGHRIRVIGLPDLSEVRSMMLGVMNPKEGTGPEYMCAEVWFNELRVSGLANKGGWAANARLVTQLADFAKVNVSANYQAIGFGGIDKTLNERSLEQTFQYDISSNIELGKFFPVKSGITIPMFIGWNENFINPKYYPLNPDILYSEALKFAPNEEEKKKIKETSQDYTSRYSLNFLNVKKNRTGSGNPHIWDIENFSFSYSYQNVYRRNQIVEENFIKTHKASIQYGFSSKARAWEPFRTKIKSKRLVLIRNFNLNLVPNSFGARLDVDRHYAELQNRSNDNFNAIVPRFYDKSFTMQRLYTLNWNLTKSLKFDYNSTADAWIEEPFGPIDTEEKRDTIRKNLYNLGTLRTFNQTANVNYTLPLRQTRLFNWINVTARYTANYGWSTAPPAVKSLGNTIQNSQTISLNSNLNFNTFYNRFKVLRKITTDQPKRKPTRTTNDEDGADEESTEEKDQKKKEDEINPIVKGAGRFLLMLKQASFTVTQTNGTTIPGFIREPDILGQNFGYNAPGFEFIAGLQDPEIRYNLARNGHLTGDTLQNNPYIELSSTTYSGKATLEPFKNLRINLDYDRRISHSVSSMFRYDPETGGFTDFGLQESGMFSTTFFAWKTAFDKVDQENPTYPSDAFDRFNENRLVIANRIQQQELTSDVNSRFADQIGVIDSTTGFPIGFNRSHQDVLLYSFLSAYTGQDAAKIKLSPFSSVPIPSWRINYNGLKDLFGLDQIFTNINITHGYNSTLTMNSFITTLTYGDDSLQTGENLSTEFTFQQGVTISERFLPLIGLDITLKNGITGKIEYKKDRTLTLNMITFQLIEQRNTEWVIGGGYRTSGVRLPLKWKGERIFLKNDLNFRMDFSIRDGITVLRQFELGTNTPQAGMRSLSIRPSIDYKINDKMNFRAFYNRNVNTPKTSQSYPTALTDFGFSVRYTIQ